jgi:uncharacterized phiE125 gp8 family phage protein
MEIKGITTTVQPSIEPITVADLRAHLRLDTEDGEIAPTAPAAALAGTGAGNLSNGAYRYRVTFVTADGETEGGDITGAVSVADNATNGQIALTAIPLGGAYVTSRKIYRTEADGSDYLLLATIADNTTTTYNDNIADGSLGAAAPVTNTTEDPYLNTLIGVVRHTAENVTKRRLITQTVKIYLDCFPRSAWFELILPPVQSVTSLQYVDTNGVTQTLSTDAYQVSLNREIAVIRLNEGYTWPDTDDVLEGVIVTAVVGYGDARADVPAPIKQAMLLLAGHLYNQRETVVFGVIPSKVPDTFDDLISPYRIREV